VGVNNITFNKKRCSMKFLMRLMLGFGLMVVPVLAQDVAPPADGGANSTVQILLQKIKADEKLVVVATYTYGLGAEWQSTNGNKWRVPAGGGFGKVFRSGKLPFNANCGYYTNVVRPDPGADWTGAVADRPAVA
jgi:hypothetical protein